ncbi:MAG TPA: DoxX family protein [Candidatus Nitrosotenuis sp.]|nr:DoxX family protein [Candidatus Nitrosotenuis sp.]
MRLTPAGLALALGRACLAAIFVLSGFEKLWNWPQVAQQLAWQGWPVPELLGLAAMLLELVGGLLLLTGFLPHLAAGMLLLFLIPVTWSFHNFWSGPGLDRFQQIQFLKNLAIMGGLLVVLAPSLPRSGKGEEQD